jgi:hypothetical protein
MLLNASTGGVTFYSRVRNCAKNPSLPVANGLTVMPEPTRQRSMIESNRTPAFGDDIKMIGFDVNILIRLA